MDGAMKAPSFRKGQLVRVREGRTVSGWRRSTPEEKHAWYEWHGREVKAGRAFPFDSGGEPHLAPSDTLFTLQAGTVLEVRRARVSAPFGYETSKDCCQVFCPSNGETLFVKRLSLVDTW